MCRCNQGNEDTHHFFCSCPFYGIQRATLADSVRIILQNNKINNFENQSQLYLNGHQSKNSTENRKSLLSTIKYI